MQATRPPRRRHAGAGPVTHPADRDLLDDLSTDRVALSHVPDQPFPALTQDRAERSRARRTRLSAGTGWSNWLRHVNSRVSNVRL